MTGTNKKIIVYAAVYGLFFYCLNKVSQCFRMAPGGDVGSKILYFKTGAVRAFNVPLPSINKIDLLVGLLGVLLLFLAVRIHRENLKKFRHGEEYGSAR